jgi:hypothetical protein
MLRSYAGRPGTASHGLPHCAQSLRSPDQETRTRGQPMRSQHRTFSLDWCHDHQPHVSRTVRELRLGNQRARRFLPLLSRGPAGHVVWSHVRGSISARVVSRCHRRRTTKSCGGTRRRKALALLAFMRRCGWTEHRKPRPRNGNLCGAEWMAYQYRGHAKAC